MEQRIRVTRTLVYEGDADWVQETLARSYIQIGDEVGFMLKTPRGVILETARVEETIDSLEE